MDGPGNDLVQIIDGEGEFMELPELVKRLNETNFTNRGFDYYVVAILGCQSSGKSTLLNLLFGTSFQVMQSEQGRQQTTLGVWMGRASARTEKEETILVFDVEGTDAGERGDQHVNFEQKTSLFSLALAEVLIINMWHHDIGRYNAGNIALLKTVMEANLRLFQKNKTTKTLIVFVIRDHIPKQTPLEKLQQRVMNDMKGIWDDLIKPSEFENSKAEDFFDFTFTSLAHKELAEDQFMEQVEQLRERFVNPEASGFFLQKHYVKDIPADGFAAYAHNIWDVIKQDKDFDIPTQKEMLAMYRCDEIIESTVETFHDSMKEIKKSIEREQLVENFGEKSKEKIEEALALYDEPASRYHHATAQKKRETLTQRLYNELNELFKKQIKTLLEKTLSSFEESLSDEMPLDGSASKEFSKISSSKILEATDYFGTVAKESIVEGSDWNYEKEYESLKDSLEKILNQIRKEQLERLMKEMEEYCKEKLNKPIDKIIDKSTEKTLWPKIREHYEEVKETLKGSLEERLEGFDIDNAELEQKQEELDKITFQALKKKFADKSKYVHYIMMKKFETSFNTDEKGLPRRWSPNDDIGECFKEAKKKADGILENYALLRVTPEMDEIRFLDPDFSGNVDPDFVIISSDECEVLKEKFEQEARSSYLQAKRDQENVSSAAHVPMYIVILIIVLGFNEFIHVITNPLLLFLCVLIGISIYVINLLNMGGYAQRVMTTVLQTSVSSFQQWVTNTMNHKLHENSKQKAE